MRRIAVCLALLLAACSSPGTGTASQAASSSAELTASPVAAFTLPPRPDIATDGTCDEGWRCLGLLTPGAHRTKYVRPNFSFEIAEPGWENLRGAGGLFDIRLTDSPGDELWFLQEVTARSAEGERPFGASGRPQELAELGSPYGRTWWLRGPSSRPQLAGSTG